MTFGKLWADKVFLVRAMFVTVTLLHNSLPLWAYWTQIKNLQLQPTAVPGKLTRPKIQNHLA